MKKTKHVVFDTNSLISAFLIKSSLCALALDRVIATGRLASSTSCLHEFSEVIFRAKFDSYFKGERERMEAIEQVERNAIIFLPMETIVDCRDLKDNKFLELAVEAKAQCVITGDKDLLVLNPFRGIPILTPADFLLIPISIE